MGIRLSMVVLALGACASGPETVVYRAKPAAEQDWGDRLHVEQRGIRVVLGPVSAFPYRLELAEGALERGRYQLYTRVRVHNTGAEAVEVLWSAARLIGPGGESWRLLAAGDRWPANGTGGDTDRERLDPGAVTGRAVIPETIEDLGLGEPLVPLCDGCEFRMRLPVRGADGEFAIEARFRLEEERRTKRRGGPDYRESG